MFTNFGWFTASQKHTHAHTLKRQTGAMPSAEMAIIVKFDFLGPKHYYRTSTGKQHTLMHHCSATSTDFQTQGNTADFLFEHKEIFSDKRSRVSQRTHPSQRSHVFLSKHPSEFAHFNYLVIEGGPLVRREILLCRGAGNWDQESGLPVVFRPSFDDL